MLLIVGLAFAVSGLQASYAAQGVSHEWGSEFQVNTTSGPASGVVGYGLAVDSQNHLHATWTDRSSGKSRAYFASSVDNGQTWSDATDFSLSALPAYGPNIAIGSDDILHVAWLDRIDEESRIYHSRSLDGGLSWETPKAVSAESEIDAQSISISVDTSKRVHLSWHAGNPNLETETAQVYYARSLDNGKTFQEPLKLNTDTDAHAAFPRFNVQGTDGEVVAVPWRDQRAGNWDIYMAVSTDAGKSFEEYFVYAAPGERHDYDPAVIVDPNGVLHLTYFSNRRGGSVINYHFSTDQGQTWSKPVVLSEPGIFSRFPLWVPDYEHDTIWVFWKDERDLGTAACPGSSRCADIVARYTSDIGLTWSDLEFVTDLGDVEVKLPSPAVGPDGIVHVIWSDTRDGIENEGVYIKSRLSLATND
jgi:hypothetical protein